jgi:hypothetical protein
VSDTTGPIVSLNGSNSLTIEAGSSFAEAGANWTDVFDGSGMISTASGTVNTVLPGTYLLSYTKTDRSGNISNVALRTIVVQDTIAPNINLNGNLSMTIEASTGAFVDPGASYTDTVISIGTIPGYTS